MVPKTKNQKRVEELSSTLRCLKKKQEKWVNKTCFEHLGFRMKKGTTCLECGHEFHAIGERSKCPKCKTDLKILDTRKRSNSSFGYACFIDVCKEWQVVRYFEVFQGYEKGKAVSYSSAEVVQIWLNGKGEVVCRARLKAGMFSSKFSWWSPMAIRSKTESYMYMSTDAEYPDMKFIPELIRNGFNGVIGSYAPQDLFHTLLSRPEMETLYKAGQMQLFEYFFKDRDSSRIREYWPAVKQVFRQKYIPTSMGTWIDYINLLMEFKQDIHNPKLVCPENLNKEHDRYVNKRNKIWERRRIERDLAEQKRLRAQMETDNKKYLKEKAKFLNLFITDGKIVIEPLKSIIDFKDEGIALKHCVFQEYYYSKDKLILSAKINGVKLETIEVSLNDFTIQQCRGYKNKRSRYHRKIVLLMKNHLDLVRKMSKSRKPKLSHAA